MKKALALARKGVGRTSPNPPVGAVIVKDGAVVGQGFHERAGEAHAEVNAITDGGEACRGATIYVTLEPCNHTGKTPPCTKAILDAGIAEVVVGCSDPNPKVEGGGARFLESHGVKVRMGCMEEECMELVAPFAKLISTGTPWVIAKAATSLDGKIATYLGHSQWITNDLARREGHRLRSRVDAILIGRGTLHADDPQLTCRIRGGRNPIRVVLDSGLTIRYDARIVDTRKAPTMVFCTDGREETAKADRLRDKGVLVEGTGMGPKVDLIKVLERLGSMGCQSLLVEGGGEVLGSFFDAGLVDEGWFFFAPMVIGGLGAPSAIKGRGVDSLDEAPRMIKPVMKRLKGNFLIHGLFTDPRRFWTEEEPCSRG